MREILSVENVKVHFKHFLEEPVKAVDDVSFKVVEGDNFGIIGETGSGKTTISNLITGLLGSWNKRGDIKFFYRDALADINKIPYSYLRSHLQMAFQDSGLALNPRIKIGENLKEVYRINYKKIDFKKNIETLIHEVGLSSAILDKFPSDLSGGMKRRVFLARSFAALAYLPEDISNNVDNSKLLILDEITLGLDVPLQNKILNFLLNVQKKLALTYLVISHDLNIISLLCKKLIVLHRGRLVESMDKECLTGKRRALHPYTNLLLDSYHGKQITIPEKDIDAIGNILLEGCRSRDVCANRDEVCLKNIPKLTPVTDPEKPETLSEDSSHFVACHKYKKHYMKLKTLVCLLVTIFFVSPVWANNVVLLMDNSGSMRKNDPDFWSKSSAKFFVDRCSDSDRVSIIPFDSSLRKNKTIKLANPVKSHDKIIKFIESMDYKGPWTDYYWGLLQAYKHLKNLNENKYVVMFTDGEPDPDRKDKLYRGMKRGQAAKKNKKLTEEIINKLYKPNNIKIFTIAFTNKSDIRFMQHISKLSSGRHDFGFQVDKSYGISEVFLRISNLIPALSTSSTYGIFVPPNLAKDFLLINLDKRIGRRNYVNQIIMETLSQFAALSGRKGLSVSEYYWPELSKINDVDDVVRRFSKIHDYLIVMDFDNNAQSGEYFVYDFTRKHEKLLNHKKWDLGILSILCEKISQGIFSDLKNYKMKKEVTYPVTVRYIGTKQPAIASVNFIQDGREVKAVTDAFGHAIFVGLQDEPFRMVFRKSGVKLGEWLSGDYRPDKVFYIDAAFDVHIAARGIPWKIDDLDPNYKTPHNKIPLKANAELSIPGNKSLTGNTDVTFKNIPIGIRKLRLNFNADMPKAYLPFIEYISVSKDLFSKDVKRILVTLDKNYMPLFKELLENGNIKVAVSRAVRLFGLHHDHPQVFDVISYLSDAYRRQGKYGKALEVLLIFQKKYQDNFFYRKPGGVLNDRFVLYKTLGELKLIDSITTSFPSEFGEKEVLNNMGLADIKEANKLYIKCQNSIMPSQHVKPANAMEFFLTMALTELRAKELFPKRNLELFMKYFAQYKNMLKEKVPMSSEMKLMLSSGILSKLYMSAEAVFKL